MAVVLILLLVGLFTGNALYYKIAIPALIMNMIYPYFYYYFGIFWIGLSHLIGTVVSKVLLSLVYFLVVLPMAMIRRLMGKDSLRLKQFKKSTSSIMHVRNHEFKSDDIIHPF
jgi:hypothetical protein